MILDPGLDFLDGRIWIRNSEKYKTEAMALLYPRPFWFQNILTGYCVRTSNYPVLRVPEIKARFMPRFFEAIFVVIIHPGLK